MEKEAGESLQDKSGFVERVGLTYFWLVVLVYAYFVPVFLNWNSESHLYPAFSLVDHGSVTIDRYHQGLGDQSFWHGHYFSDKAPGLTFLAVPVYALLRVILNGQHGEGYQYVKHFGYYISWDMVYLRFGITLLLVILPSAALSWLLWLFLSQLSGRRGWALLLTSVYAFGTIAYVYSGWYFSHQVAAVLLFGSFLLLFWKVRQVPPTPRTYLFAACAGLLAGYAVISEYPTALVAVGLGLYVLAVAGRRILSAMAFGAGMIPAAILAMGYNMAAFGQPLATGYMHLHSQYYKSHVHGGLAGLANPDSYGIVPPTWNSIWQITLGTYRGLFFVCPVLLLFFAGLVFMWRRRELRPELWLCAGVVVLYFLMDASRGLDQNGWSGGASIASRHLDPMLPFMIVPMALGLRDRLFRVALLVLGAVSISIMFMIVSLTSFFSFSDQNLLFNEVLPYIGQGRIGSNWGSIWFGLSGLWSLAPLEVVVLAFVSRLLWLFVNERRAAPALAPVHSVETETESPDAMGEASLPVRSVPGQR